MDLKNFSNPHVINLTNVTKVYADNVGVFDLNIKISAGEVYGFIGPNGAGKSTTIRQIVGFIKPQNGSITINGKSVWDNTKELMDTLGYLPGEIIIPDYMKGITYLKACADIRGNVDWLYVEKLINYFELNPKVKIKKMSKGTKQKVALIATFMHQPKILILDEPTSGLDPLMQEKLLKIIKDYKEKGTTIFFSSHIFSEVETLADKIAIIKKGRIISEILMKDIKQSYEKIYLIKFINQIDVNQFLQLNWKTENLNKDKSIKVFVGKEKINDFLKDLTKFQIDSYTEEKFKLDEHFLKFYGGEINDQF